MAWVESRVDWDDDDATWRRSFPTLTAFIYVDHWLAVLRAEKNAACVELNDEWSEAEKTEELIRKGFCILNAVAEYIDNRRVWRLSWPSSNDCVIGSEKIHTQ